MSSLALISPIGLVIAAYDSDDLGIKPVAGALFGRQRLDTEAVGSFTLTIKNAVVGSRYRISRSGDNSLATPTGSAEGTVPGVSGLVDVSITLDYYAPGNANNDLKIDVRKATAAPKYKPFQTFATAASGTVLAYCAQESDPIA